jgi:colanic acid biosynthesis protein WcaH
VKRSGQRPGLSRRAVADTGRLVDALADLVPEPSQGLPEEVFLLVSGLTPLVNVDLLVRNERRQTLLTWRDDGRHPAGWHVPGGIVRFKETLHARIRAVAVRELGADVTFRPEPIAVHEIIHPSRRVRGHFISFLYECVLTGPPCARLRYDGGVPRADQWAWHDGCPANLIDVHEIYRPFMG